MILTPVSEVRSSRGFFQVFPVTDPPLRAYTSAASPKLFPTNLSFHDVSIHPTHVVKTQSSRKETLMRRVITAFVLISLTMLASGCIVIGNN
jgi:hypothetical protein